MSYVGHQLSLESKRFSVMRGFAPAPRATFVSAKVAKTSDAPSGLMRGAGRQLAESGPTRLAQTRSAGEISVPPFGQPEGVGVLSYSVILSHWRRICAQPNDGARA